MKIKNERGVTLIALIITIIVILLLVYVSVRTMIDSGLFRKASSTVKDFDQVQLEEQIKTIQGDWHIGRTINPFDNTISDFWEKLKEADIINDVEADIRKVGDGKYIIHTKKGYNIEITIDEDQKMVPEQDGEIVWKDEEAIVKLTSKVEGTTIQYKINEEGEYLAYEGEISGLKHGDKVYTRLVGKVNKGEEIIIQINDDEKPTNEIKLSTQQATTDMQIRASVTQKDSKSGIDITRCKWVYNTKSTEVGTKLEDYTGTFSSNDETITVLPPELPGTYYLHVLTTDKAGNMKEIISNPVQVVQLMKTIELSIDDNILNPTVTAQCTVKVVPENTSNKNIRWTSSDDRIATVDQNGKVTAHSVGAVEIIATAQDAGGISKSVTINVIPIPVLKENNQLKACYYKNDHSNSKGIEVEMVIELTEHIADYAENYEIVLTTESGAQVSSADNIIENGVGTVSLTYWQKFNTIEEIQISVMAYNEGGIKVPISGKVYTIIGVNGLTKLATSSGISMTRPSNVVEGTLGTSAGTPITISVH